MELTVGILLCNFLWNVATGSSGGVMKRVSYNLIAGQFKANTILKNPCRCLRFSLGESSAFVFLNAHLAYRLRVGETLGEARVGVGTVWVGLRRVPQSPTGSIGNILLLQPGSWPRSLPDSWCRARLGHVGALGSLVIFVPQAAVAPLAVRVVDLLAVKRGPGRRADWSVPVVLTGRAPNWRSVVAAGAHSATDCGGHLIGRAPFALQIGVVVRRELPVVWFVRHGVRVEGAADKVGMAILLGEPVMPPNSPVSIYGEAWLPSFQGKVPAGGIQIARVAGIVVVESILL